MHTIVGLFETRAKARRVKGALIRAHIASPNIVLCDRSAADSSWESEQSFWDSLKDSSGFAEDRRFYEEGMRRGGTVLSVRINDEQMNPAAEILSTQGAVDLNTEGAESRNFGSPTKGPPCDLRPDVAPYTSSPAKSHSFYHVKPLAYRNERYPPGRHRDLAKRRWTVLIDRSRKPPSQ